MPQSNLSAILAGRRGISVRLAGRLARYFNVSAAGAVYATVFGSMPRGQVRTDSDIDIDVSVNSGRPMSADLRVAVIGLVADVSGRSVDLVDLDTANGLVLARALGGVEILCDNSATRRRMAARLLRSEDATGSPPREPPARRAFEACGSTSTRKSTGRSSCG